MSLTKQQQDAIDTVKNEPLTLIKAVAGSGKTFTLIQMVEQLKPKTGLYIAYNKSIAEANLDLDDTTSYGPETVTISGVDTNAVYTYYVHNYSGGPDDVLANSTAKVDVYSGGTARTFYVPNEDGLYWRVFEIVDGLVVPCTENCVQPLEESMARSLNKEALLFEHQVVKPSLLSLFHTVSGTPLCCPLLLSTLCRETRR